MRADREHVARDLGAVAEHALQVEREQEHRAEGVAVEEPLHEERIGEDAVLRQERHVEQRALDAALQEDERHDEREAERDRAPAGGALAQRRGAADQREHRGDDEERARAGAPRRGAGRRQEALSRSWIGAMRSRTTAPPTMNTERQPQCSTSKPAQIGPSVRPA